jgi:hypothetical protein
MSRKPSYINVTARSVLVNRTRFIKVESDVPPPSVDGLAMTQEEYKDNENLIKL